MNYICPTLGEGHELDFLVTGTLDSYKIIVFSSHSAYEEGFKFLNLADYQPNETSFELFYNLAINDEAFDGLILNIHKENKIITKDEIIQMKE